MDGGGYLPVGTTSTSAQYATSLDDYGPLPPHTRHGMPWLAGAIIAAFFVVLLAVATGVWKPVYALFLTDDQAADMRATDALLDKVTMFSVACPPANLSAADQQRWASYTQSKGWTPYPAAGPGCVDP